MITAGLSLWAKASVEGVDALDQILGQLSNLDFAKTALPDATAP